MKNWSPNARKRWKRRVAADLGLHRINSVQRELLNHLVETQRLIDTLPANATMEQRLTLQRAYQKTITTLRALRHR
jgi:hypothetical protein